MRFLLGDWMSTLEFCSVVFDLGGLGARNISLFEADGEDVEDVPTIGLDRGDENVNDIELFHIFYVLL